MSDQDRDPASPATNDPTAVSGASETGTPDLTRRLEALARHFREVTERLGPVLAGMVESGTPPPYQSVEALADCHRRFLRLRNEFVEELPEAERTPESSERFLSLDDLRRFAGSISNTLPESLSTPEPDTPKETSPVPSAEPSSPVIAETSRPVEQDATEESTPDEPCVEPLATSVVEPIVDAPLAHEEPPATHVAHSEPLEWEAGLDATPWPPARRDEEESSEPSVVEEMSPPIVAGVTYSDQIEPPVVEDSDATPAVEEQPDEVVQAEPEMPVAVAEDEQVQEEAGPSNTAALAVLERAGRVRLRDGSEPPELLQFLNEVRVVRDALESHEPRESEGLSNEILEGSHPIARLLQAIEAPEQLSDIAWADLHARISTSFGRPFALAMARRKLVLDPDGDGEAARGET